MYVEDSEDDALLVLRELERAGYEATFERVETPEAMRASLDRQAWDVVICDYVLPRFSAPAALEALQEQGRDLPFIIVSGKVGEETAVAAMRADAHDYVLKHNLTRLVPAIKRELQEAEVRRERKRADQALRESERRFREMTDLLPDMVFETDADLRISYANRQALVTLGYAQEDLEKGLRITDLIADDSPTATPLSLEELEARDEPLVDVHQVKCKDGSLIPCEISLAPMREPNGVVAGSRQVIRDITERRNAAEVQRPGRKRRPK